MHPASYRVVRPRPLRPLRRFFENFPLLSCPTGDVFVMLPSPSTGCSCRPFRRGRDLARVMRAVHGGADGAGPTYRTEGGQSPFKSRNGPRKPAGPDLPPDTSVSGKKSWNGTSDPGRASYARASHGAPGQMPHPGRTKGHESCRTQKEIVGRPEVY